MMINTKEAIVPELCNAINAAFKASTLMLYSLHLGNRKIILPAIESNQLFNFPLAS